MTEFTSSPAGKPDKNAGVPVPPAGATQAEAANEAPSPEDLLLLLRRKQENWVAWAEACQQLQKAGYSPQKIFEETGFEPIHQNQIMAARQVFVSLANHPATDDVLQHFQTRGSDLLYELRILTQAGRVSAATLCLQKQLDADGAKEVARAVQDYARLGERPQEFTEVAGDAVAYQSWKLARQKSDLQERSRLIARGLSYAESESARRQVEALLTDFAVVRVTAKPRLPFYRPDSDEQLPRAIPVVGRLPLTVADLQTVPVIDETGPFRLVQHHGPCAWVPLPGWQVLLAAEDPVGIFCQVQQLPLEGSPGKPEDSSNEEVLVVVDRCERDWRGDSYFLSAASTAGSAGSATDEQLVLSWFDTAPTQPLLGRVILVVRPKRVFDEGAMLEAWTLED